MRTVTAMRLFVDDNITRLSADIIPELMLRANENAQARLPVLMQKKKELESSIAALRTEARNIVVKARYPQLRESRAADRALLEQESNKLLHPKSNLDALARASQNPGRRGRPREWSSAFTSKLPCVITAKIYCIVFGSWWI